MRVLRRRLALAGSAGVVYRQCDVGGWPSVGKKPEVYYQKLC
ncbi:MULTISPECIES: hypothetical protein [Tenebrionibacter/Tenebrionicola group]|jgi:hypothetical protein|nr:MULTISPECIES: hypothetical protein [Tenebrionibacter/Tenebrionicola group]